MASALTPAQRASGIVALGAVLALLLGGAAGAAANGAADAAGTTVTAGAPAMAPHALEAGSVELFAPDGTISRVEARLPVGTPMTAAELEAADEGVSALQVAGPSENRYDLVFVGDGYTAAELDLYHEHVADKWRTIVETEPFTTYAQFFNVWVVDVVSNESGVDNDPTPPTDRDTALDMYFWCSGVERGLCVDETKARQMADLAPEADQIVALANATKYGGIGGTVATSSGGNAAAGLITVHELGHSLGGLADEYDYYLRAGLEEDAAEDVTFPVPFTYYPGAVLGEPGGVNITAEPDAEQMVADELKWWRWVGDESPDGGTVGTYEGGGYYRYGMYRPTQDSLMHTLGTPEDPNPFNLPSLEQMTRRFYGVVRPIDAVHPAGGALASGDVAAVDVVAPSGHALDVRWFVDGVEVTTARGALSFTVDEAAAAGSELTVRVTDPTDFVRDPAAAELLTQEASWSL